MNDPFNILELPVEGQRSDPLDILNIPVDQPGYQRIPEPTQRAGMARALSEGLKAFPRAGAAALDIGTALGTGAIGWGAGKVVGGAERLFGSLARRDPEDIDYTASVLEDAAGILATTPPGAVERMFGIEGGPGEYVGRKTGEALEKGFSWASDKLGIQELSKTHPNLAWALQTGLEIATFALVHKGSRGALRKLSGKPLGRWTANDWADANKLNEELGKRDWVKSATPAEGRFVYPPEQIPLLSAHKGLLPAPESRAPAAMDAEFTVKEVRQLGLPERALPAPQLKLPYEGRPTAEPGEGIDLALPSAQQPKSVKKFNIVSKRAGEQLGYKIRFDNTVEQPEGMAPWHGFTFLEGPAEGGSFTVIKKGRVSTKDIVKAGKAILEQREPIKAEPAVNPIKVYRTQEVGEIDYGKPQGLYLEKKLGELTEGMEGKASELTIYPKNPLIVQPELMVDHRRGRGSTFEASSGIKALKRLVGDKEFERLMKMNKRALLSELRSKYPDVQWNRYHDSYEMLEGYAGVVAREKGYDSIVGDKSEIVVLDESTIEKPSDIAKIGEKEITKKDLLPMMDSLEAERALREIDPELRGFLRNPTTVKYTPLKEKIDTIGSRLSPSDEFNNMAVDRMLVAINRAIGGLEGEGIEKAPPIRPKAKKEGVTKLGLDELRKISEEAKEVGVDIDIKENRVDYFGEVQDENQIEVGYLSNYKGIGRREMFELLDDVFKVAADNDRAVTAMAVNPKVGEALKALGAQGEWFPEGEDLAGRWTLPPERVKEIVQEGGLTKALRRAKNAKRAREKGETPSEEEGLEGRKGRRVRVRDLEKDRVETEAEAPKEEIAIAEVRPIPGNSVQFRVRKANGNFTQEDAVKYIEGLGFRPDEYLLNKVTTPTDVTKAIGGRLAEQLVRYDFKSRETAERFVNAVSGKEEAPKETIVHGVLDTRDLSSIYREGLKPGTSTGGQALEHPIILFMEKGPAKQVPVSHRPGDFTLQGRSGKIKEIWLDRDEFIGVRASEEIMMEMLDKGEPLGYSPEDLGRMTPADFRRAGHSELARLSDELHHSDTYGQAPDWRGYLEKIKEATEGKVPIKVFKTNIDVDPPKKIFTGEGYTPEGEVAPVLSSQIDYFGGEEVPKRFTPEEASERVNLIRQRYEKLQAEGKVKTTLESPEYKKYVKSREDVEDFLYSDSKESRWNDPDGDLSDYGLDDFSGDLFKTFIDPFVNDRGGFSPSDLSPEQIAAINRLRRKAKMMGEDLGDFLRKAGHPEERVKDILEFVDKYLDFPELPGPQPTDKLLEMSDDAILFQQTRTIKPRGTRVVPVTISFPPYKASYLKNWLGSSDVKIAGTKSHPRLGAFNEWTIPHARMFERAAPFLKEELFNFYNDQRGKQGVHERLLLSELRYFKSLVPNTKESGKRIYQHAISKQKGGKLLLQANGWVVPKLTPEELKVYESMETRLRELHPMVSKARMESYKPPVRQVEHYFTFARAMGESSIYADSPTLILDDPKFVDSEYRKVRSVPFKFAKNRVKEPTYKLKDNAFDIYEDYIKRALKTIYISPVAARAHTILSPVRIPGSGGKKGAVIFDPRKQRPTTFRTINRWAWTIAGMPSPYELPPGIRRGINDLSRRVSGALLLGNVRTGAIQFTALRNTVTLLPLQDVLYGVYKSNTAAGKEIAQSRSSHLPVRNFEAVIADYFKGLEDVKVKDLFLPENYEEFKQALGTGISVPDQWTARVSWLAKIHELERKGVTGKKADVEADNFVINTQASGDPGHRSPIQNVSWGKVISTLQTFVINDWRFLIEDVLGIGKEQTVGEMMPKLFKYLLTGAVINYLTEDVAGIKSPLPRPLKVGWEGTQEGKPWYDIAADVFSEFLEPIPFFSSIRYGKPITGVIIEKINNVVTGGKYGLNSYKEFKIALRKGRLPVNSFEAIATLIGIPGTAQLAKSYRAYLRGETPWDIFWGNFSDRAGKALSYDDTRNRARDASGLRTRRTGRSSAFD